MNLLNLFKKDGILNDVGDSLNARITETGRKVLKVSKDKGKNKWSQTVYPNGTIVETRSRKSV